ncbi:transcriptional regulator [Amycolatopsis balhimycina]|uniref:transcriptional regulator n=1 Tax=Amycolatopsis balhimycina TaxID=208443 RepID=UPI00039D69DA|nr:transcriptional regulator [Amycolatopsis balhimycina]
MIARARREGRPVAVRSFSRDLDPVLLAPAGLFVVTLLAEMRWCEFGFICAALGVTPAALSTQLGKLRREGIVQTQRSKAQRTWVRLTPEGRERLVNHLEALQAMVSRAVGLVAAGTAIHDRPPPEDDL